MGLIQRGMSLGRPGNGDCLVDGQLAGVAGTRALEFRQAGDDVGRYAWIDAVLRAWTTVS